MCLGTELDLEVVVTFQTKWSSLTHPWAKHSLEGVGRPVMAEEAAPALKPGIARDPDRPTHKCGPLSRQHFTHFALTSFHLYVGPTEESSRWRRGAASNRWNGAAEADAPLFSPSVTSSSSVPSSQAAEQTPRPAVPFCPLSPDGVLRRHWRFPLPSAPSPRPLRGARGQSGAGAEDGDAEQGGHGGSTQSIRWLRVTESERAGRPVVAGVEHATDAAAITGGDTMAWTETLPPPPRRKAIGAESIGRLGAREGGERSCSLFASHRYRHSGFCRASTL